MKILFGRALGQPPSCRRDHRSRRLFQRPWPIAAMMGLQTARTGKPFLDDQKRRFRLQGGCPAHGKNRSPFRRRPVSPMLPPGKKNTGSTGSGGPDFHPHDQGHAPAGFSTTPSCPSSTTGHIRTGQKLAHGVFSTAPTRRIYFFPGGNIGELARLRNGGTILPCAGHPLYLSAALIIEEGFRSSSWRPSSPLWARPR